jgi:glycosyltransferase involved in cell wall biosynthesis
MVYDPYSFEQRSDRTEFPISSPFKVGVIGRLTQTKGMERLADLINRLNQAAVVSQYQFLLFGEVNEEESESHWYRNLDESHSVRLMGYCPNKDEIYNNIHAVFHFSTQEALGRIVLESIDYNVPFSGMNAAGVGELGKLLGFEDLLADPEKGTEEIVRVLELIRGNYEATIGRMKELKGKALTYFNAENYSEKVDNIVAP